MIISGKKYNVNSIYSMDVVSIVNRLPGGGAFMNLDTNSIFFKESLRLYVDNTLIHCFHDDLISYCSTNYFYSKYTMDDIKNKYKNHKEGFFREYIDVFFNNIRSKYKLNEDTDFCEYNIYLKITSIGGVEESILLDRIEITSLEKYKSFNIDETVEHYKNLYYSKLDNTLEI